MWLFESTEKLVLVGQSFILMPCSFQILEGKTPYFGYSIAGNMDLDRNSYPDVAVGSLSDSVTVFRYAISDFSEACSVIWLHSDFDPFN